MPPTTRQKRFGKNVDHSDEFSADLNPFMPNRKAEGIRLNKWMFTFVLTDLEGRHALTDVRYDARRTISLPHEVLQSQKP